ncbi:Oxidoreductase NAD-binding domain-containing protein 1 [Acipenser ruthenus]|uniref:Oxidoreductase NAD-binding domain-containing protein 1 n=1 Tax=Acipenser ruthenus TaxID=7906 RepID=A0A662YN31_ACIRT|nr:Oxidoreductase NAD-binding domain-containing protein 1 [Acipenser ruthenus]
MASAAAAFNHLLSRTAGTFPGQSASVLLMTRALCGCTLNRVDFFVPGVPKCTLDAEVALRVGGDFYFDPVPSEPEVELLLVAGGVGINPLYAILLHVADLHRLRASQGWGYKPGAVQLCYCAKNTQELLFKNTIIRVAQEFPGKIACDLYVTQQDTEIGEELGPYITEGRISEEVLEKHISRNSLCYICGPPPMIESISGQLEHLGVSKERILFEKWW